jgi:hypothetical protein
MLYIYIYILFLPSPEHVAFISIEGQPMAFIYRTKTVSNILFPEQIKLKLPPTNKFTLKKKTIQKQEAHVSPAELDERLTCQLFLSRRSWFHSFLNGKMLLTC